MFQSHNLNLYEVKPSPRKKRKISENGPNVYMNPALDLISKDDPICNNTMEIKPPNKRRKRSKSQSDIGTFENSALDLGIDKKAVNALITKQLMNVRQNIQSLSTSGFIHTNGDVIDAPHPCEVSTSSTQPSVIEIIEPIYANDDIVNENAKCIETLNLGNKTELEPNSQSTSLHGITNLSFIEHLDFENTQTSNQSLYLDDDLNESNIMEIKTINLIKSMNKSTNPFLNNYYADDNENVECNDISMTDYALKEVPNIPRLPLNFVQKRLFNDTNSTVSTINEISEMNQAEHNEYATIDIVDHIYDEPDQLCDLNKQSKILGQDVSKLNTLEILNNLYNNKNLNDTPNSNDSIKMSDLTHQIVKAGNKLSKKVFNKIKKTFKSEKQTPYNTANPYEIPNKPLKEKNEKVVACFENPALNLENSNDETAEDEYDMEHTYETIKTARNTLFNMNLTPLREKNCDIFDPSTTSNTPGRKQVRFDTTLNKEKIITGDSFNMSDLNETSLDMKIDKFHDELENCINENKIIAMNLK